MWSFASHNVDKHCSHVTSAAGECPFVSSTMLYAVEWMKRQWVSHGKCSSCVDWVGWYTWTWNWKTVLHPSSATYSWCRLGQGTSTLSDSLLSSMKWENWMRPCWKSAKQFAWHMWGPQEVLIGCKPENQLMMVSFLKVCRLIPCN